MTVLVTYQLQASGMKLTLDQEPSGIRVSGYKFNTRDQIAVRTIFNEIFGQQYSLNAMPAPTR